jgi:hypothetical protein
MLYRNSSFFTTCLTVAGHNGMPGSKLYFVLAKCAKIMLRREYLSSETGGRRNIHVFACWRPEIVCSTNRALLQEVGKAGKERESIAQSWHSEFCKNDARITLNF